MISAPACSPVLTGSEDEIFINKPSTESCNSVEDSLLAVNGVVNGECEKPNDFISDEECDDAADDNPVNRLINASQLHGSVALDLCRRGLQSLSRKLQKLSHLQVICSFVCFILSGSIDEW